MKKIFYLFKNISVVVFSLLILCQKNIYISFFIFLVLIGLNLTTSTLKTLIKRISYFIVLGLSIFVFHLFFNTELLINEKIVNSILTFLKLTNISLLILVWINTTSTSQIIDSLFWLPKNARLLITMTFYFIPTIIYEATQISIVQKSRGSNSFLKNPFPLIVPLLHRVLKKAEALSLTIAGRGYRQ